MTGAPMKNEKGRLIGMFWFLFNLGGVIGSFIAMGVNFDSTINRVSDATYAVFISLMGAGFLSALLLLSPTKIWRNDGSQVRLDDSTARPNVVKDFLNILTIFKRKETYTLILFFFASNFFYTYQQNTVNGRLFDIRTRGFNGGFYWLGALMAPLFGRFLDNRRMNTRRTAAVAFTIIFLLHIAVYIGGLMLQLRSPSSIDDKGSYMYMPHEMDMMDSGKKFAGPFVLYFLYGVFDTLWQTFIYWIIGYLGKNDDDVTARYVGLYKAVQSAGAAVAWKLNEVPINYHVEFAINWGLIGGALVFFIPLLFWMEK